MPAKKKTVKRKSTASKSTKSYGTDDKSFLIIVAGGFLLIILALMFLGSTQKKLPQTDQVSVSEQAMAGKKVVVIKNNAFSPSDMTVQVGDTVVWRNQDPVEQAVLAKDGSFKTETMFQGGFRSVTFTKPGTFTYYSNKYPSMQATITVE